MNLYRNTITFEEIQNIPKVCPELATFESTDGRHRKTLYALVDMIQRTVSYEIEIRTMPLLDDDGPIHYETLKYASLNDAIEGFNKIGFPEQGELKFEGWREPIESPGVSIYEMDTYQNVQGK